MEHSRRTHGRLILFKFLLGLILLSMSTCLESVTLPSSNTFGNNETDRQALLDLKKRITQDPLHVMSSWNDSIDFCSWVGVKCNHSTKRVLILNLNSQKLVGSIPYHLLLGILLILQESTSETTAFMAKFLKKWVVYS
ncbi:putative LRR receptor-like serine/threonine-protein kinase [Prunus yedoensis var. nudiflora]|uniref:Putative LRR receptor-like serine/threonine-protein kinase n=1 Tax=Prunus yedoensis var. nudiflora TaxID=2094558 RepID=A0A314XNB8_PRUYE|nr:putative LRR receptor-like serine/threonine-protein kinase [Prunus yedoensis var. nudiflora]